MRRTVHRRDTWHNECLAELRRLGHAHIDIHNYGGGMGDVLAPRLRGQEPVFLELKTGRKDKLTPAETKFAAMFPGHHVRVHTVEEVLMALGYMDVRR